MKVLILCTGNSCRSQMADGFLRSFDPRLTVRSAGSRPADEVNPFAVRVMREADVDLSGAEPRNVSEFLGEPWDYVVTVCSAADRDCPAFFGEVGKRLHIGFPDPAEATGSEQEILKVFRESRDSIEQSFRDFYEEEIQPKLEASA